MEESQCEQILELLKAGKRITALDALSKVGCFRLAARIWDLRQKGHDIKERTVETESGKMISECWVDIPQQPELFAARRWD
jgi:hypothetical protein